MDVLARLGNLARDSETIFWFVLCTTVIVWDWIRTGRQLSLVSILEPIDLPERDFLAEELVKVFDVDVP